MDVIRIYFDGACKNEKGVNCPMGLGVAIFVNDEYRDELSRAILVEDYEIDGTSNVGEWLALIESLKMACQFRKTSKIDIIRIFGDSKLVVSQSNLIWKIKEIKFRPFLKEVLQLKDKAKVQFIRWIPREENTKADELSKMALNLKKEGGYDL